MFTGIKGQEVSVGPSKSAFEGSCNGCTSYITSEGQTPHRVWIIKVRGTSIRLCDECKKELLKQLMKYETPVELDTKYGNH